MKTLVIHAPLDLRLEEVELDDQTPQADEVIIETAIGGVCGSDLHYYNHGGFGPVKLKQPMILGHEVSGYVKATGSNVTDFHPGELVAVSPSRPCYQCQYCLKGQQNHCIDMQFYGSAMPWPHIQGVFREQLTVKAIQCVKAEGLTPAEAATAEPLAVALHATQRAGDLVGKRVLITGCGPIGVLCAITARLSGAAEIVATDIADNALAMGKECGVDQAINVLNNKDALASYSKGKGYFDVMFECSGNEQALRDGIAALRPRSILMQVGLGGDMSLPLMQMTAKEIDLRGSFRFHPEFETAVTLMQNKRVNVKPLVTHTLPLDSFEEAFKIANDRSIAMKTQIQFNA